uniref:Sema domain-containing protein n=1 Tax=Oryzias sinensis TaxID=183150 RepID=A0A8C7ZN56_9TELE
MDSLLFSMLLWILCPSVRGWCDHASERTDLNLSVTYDLPTFTADFPVQNMVIVDGIIYVGAINRIYALAPNLTKLSEYHTGPLSANETCGQTLARRNSNEKVDNHNIALVGEKMYDQGLYSCGSVDNGVCRRHVLNEGNGLKTVDEDVYCFADKVQLGNGQPSDSDVVVSPSGSQVLNVESNFIHFFVGNSEIPGKDNVKGMTTHPHTISLRKMRTSQDGFTFESGSSYMDLIPSLRGNYYLRYVYSFHSGPFTYFLTVQKVSWDSQAYHTRIVRMCSSDKSIRRYVEMPLECISTNKRRRRSGSLKVFNILQAAHFTRVGKDEEMLFAAFAQGKPNSPEPTPNSAICIMTIKQINERFRSNIQGCSTVEPYHFTGSDRKSCHNLVRVRLFLSIFGELLVTCISFFFKVLYSRSSSPHVNVRLDSRPVSTSVVLPATAHSKGAVIVATGNKITKIPLIGPGCSQMTTCTSCLLSSNVTECGWCNGRCTRKNECPSSSTWTQDYCMPVITKFSPASGPLLGSTIVTICGRNFGFNKTKTFKGSDTLMLSVNVAGVPCKFSKGSIKRYVGACIPLLFICCLPHSTHNLQLCLCLQDPVINDIFPTFGPKSGNTMLTIRGAFLDTGNQQSVTIGEKICKIQSLTSTMITCKTPSHAFTSKEWVKLTIDSVKRQAATQFTYNEDPIIINIQPSHSFMR